METELKLPDFLCLNIYHYCYRYLMLGAFLEITLDFQRYLDTYVHTYLLANS